MVLVHIHIPVLICTIKEICMFALKSMFSQLLSKDEVTPIFSHLPDLSFENFQVVLALFFTGFSQQLKALLHTLSRGYGLWSKDCD
jgi:hypothetical protein